MDLAIIAGNSLKNKEWIKAVANAMGTRFQNVLPHFYQHWETKENFLNFDSEVELFSKDLTGKENFSIFAKSAGVMVSLKSIFLKNLLPKKCIFVGMPVYWARDNNIQFEDWLKNFSIPALFIQHTNDPVISSKDLKQLLQENNVTNFHLIEIPGDSHEYPEIEELAKLTAEFIRE